MLPPGNEHPGLYTNGTVAARQPHEIERRIVEIFIYFSFFQMNSLQELLYLLVIR